MYGCENGISAIHGNLNILWESLRKWWWTRIFRGSLFSTLMAIYIMENIHRDMDDTATLASRSHSSPGTCLGNLGRVQPADNTHYQFQLSMWLLFLSPEFSWEKFVVCRFSSPYFPSGWRDKKCTKNCWFPTDVPMNQPHETHCWCLPAPKS